MRREFRVNVPGLNNGHEQCGEAPGSGIRDALGTAVSERGRIVARADGYGACHAAASA